MYLKSEIIKKVYNMETSKRIQKQLTGYREKVEQFNADLAEYVKITESNDVPLIDCTIIGYDQMEAYIIKDRKNGFDVITDGVKYEIRIKRIGGKEQITGWIDSLDSLKEQIDYDRKRLNKGWRVWKSENPDAELEKDDEDNE